MLRDCYSCGVDYGGGWSYEACSLCGRTYVKPLSTDAHFAKFHSGGASGPVREDNAGFDSPPPPSPERKMAAALSNEELWG